MDIDKQYVKHKKTGKVGRVLTWLDNVQVSVKSECRFCERCGHPQDETQFWNLEDVEVIR